jgi:hypothetical protein
MGQTKIPVDVTFEHYLAVRSILQHVLQDLEGVAGNASKWVSCRLNQTLEVDPKPFFLGWVENAALKSVRMAANQPDPGLFRFLDDVVAETYSNSLQNPTVVKRQEFWKGTRSRPPKPPVKEELYLYLAPGHDCGYFQLPTDNEICRLSIAIKANGHYVGTLNTGLSQDPGSVLNDKIKTWGQNDTSELVQYIKNEFALGGPSV